MSVTLEDERFARIEKTLRDVEKRLQEDPCLPWATGFQVQLDRIRVRLDSLEGKPLAQGEIGTGERLAPTDSDLLRQRLERLESIASFSWWSVLQDLQAILGDWIEKGGDINTLGARFAEWLAVPVRERAPEQATGVTPLQSLKVHLDGLQAMALDNIRRLSRQQDSLREAFDFYERRLVELSGRVSAMERDAAH